MPATGIPLPRLAAHLARTCASLQRIPGYVCLWQRASAGRLPGVRLEYGRWLFDEENVPAIAEALGLKLKPALAKRLAKEADPTMKPGDPNRFVANRGDITMIPGKVRIVKGKLPPVKPVRARP